MWATAATRGREAGPAVETDPGRADTDPIHEKTHTGRRRRWALVAIALLILVCLLLAAWAYRSAAESAYERGHSRYLKLDCEGALPDLREVRGRYRFAFADFVDHSKQLVSECEALEEAAALADEGEVGSAAGRYAGFLSRFPSSEVHQPVRTRAVEAHLAWGRDTVATAGLSNRMVLAIERIEQALPLAGGSAALRERARGGIASVWARARSYPGQCRRAEHFVSISKATFDSLPAQEIARNARKAAPPQLLTCAREAYRNRRYREAISRLRTITREFPGAVPSGARTLLIDAEVASIRRGRTAALPSPVRSGSSGSSEVSLLIRNASPERLEILFSGPRSQREFVDVCRSCPKFGSDPGSSACRGDAPSRTLTVEPGHYDVVVRAPGTDVHPFSGSWDLQDGYRYESCYFIVTRSG